MSISCSCSVSWEKDDLATKTYICFLFILGLVIPLITITLSYIGIVTTIKSVSFGVIFFKQVGYYITARTARSVVQRR